jgi:hypothetical protein
MTERHALDNGYGAYRDQLVMAECNALSRSDTVTPPAAMWNPLPCARHSRGRR